MEKQNKGCYLPDEEVAASDVLNDVAVPSSEYTLAGHIQYHLVPIQHFDSHESCP